MNSEVDRRGNFATGVVVVDGVSVGAGSDLEGSPGLGTVQCLALPVGSGSAARSTTHVLPSVSHQHSFSAACPRRAPQSSAVTLIDAVALQPTTPEHLLRMRCAWFGSLFYHSVMTQPPGRPRIHPSPAGLSTLCLRTDKPLPSMVSAWAGRCHDDLACDLITRGSASDRRPATVSEETSIPSP